MLYFRLPHLTSCSCAACTRPDCPGLRSHLAVRLRLPCTTQLLAAKRAATGGGASSSAAQRKPAAPPTAAGAVQHVSAAEQQLCVDMQPYMDTLCADMHVVKADCRQLVLIEAPSCGAEKAAAPARQPTIPKRQPAPRPAAEEGQIDDGPADRSAGGAEPSAQPKQQDARDRAAAAAQVRFAAESPAPCCLMGSRQRQPLCSGT